MPCQLSAPIGWRKFCHSAALQPLETTPASSPLTKTVGVTWTEPGLIRDWKREVARLAGGWWRHGRKSQVSEQRRSFSGVRRAARCQPRPGRLKGAEHMPEDGAFNHAARADAVELDCPLERLSHAATAASVGEQSGDRRARRARGGGHVEQLLVHLQRGGVQRDRSGQIGCLEAREGADRVGEDLRA